LEARAGNSVTIHPLADQLEYHEESSNAQVAKYIGGEFIERGDVMLICSKPELGAGLNFACRIRTDEARIEQLIDEVCAWFAERNVPAPVLRVSSLTRPANVAQILERRGFGCIECETQMVLEEADIEPPTNPRVQIEWVQPHELESWVGVQHRAFGGAGNPTPTMIEMARQAAASGMTRQYLARLAERQEIVAAGTLVHWANASGIYGVATAEHARGQGVATALVRRMIHDVRATGEPICLQAQTGGAEQNWYARLGFRVVYDRTGWTKNKT
jgi:predicted GNAT family acetyltransferase